MSKELDDKLKELKIQLDYEDGRHLSDGDIAQIKQAFYEDGWIDVRGIRWNYKALHDIDIKPNGEVMTGQEWYDRFGKELQKHQDYKHVEDTFYMDTIVKEAARKAAGIE